MPRLAGLRQLGLAVCRGPEAAFQWQARVMLSGNTPSHDRSLGLIERCALTAGPRGLGAALDFGFSRREHLRDGPGIPAIPFDLCATCDRGAGGANAVHRAERFSHTDRLLGRRDPDVVSALEEMFGLNQTPRSPWAAALMLQLLSPADVRLQ